MLLDQDRQIQLIIIGQVILTMILGGFIGFERELERRGHSNS